MTSNWQTNKNNLYYDNNNGSVSINTDKPQESSFFLPQLNNGLYPTNELTNNSEYGYDQVGDVCGQFLFVSAFGKEGANESNGIVYGFEKGETEWNHFTTICGDQDVISGFGSSLSISMPYLALGSNTENAVYVYTYDIETSTWNWDDYKKFSINSSNNASSNGFTSIPNLGQCVSISANPDKSGEYILMASSTNTNTCYYGNNSSWENNTLSKIDQGSATDIDFGASLKTTYVNENGKYYPFYLIGSPGFNIEVLDANGSDNNIQGAGTCLYIYRNSIINIHSSKVTTDAGFGFSTAIGRNADYLAIGSPFFNNSDDNIQGGLVEIIYLNANKKKGNIDHTKTMKYYLSNPSNPSNPSNFGYSFDFNYTYNDDATNLTIGNYGEGSLYFYENNYDSGYNNYSELNNASEAIKPMGNYFSDLPKKIGYKTITTYNSEYEQFNVFSSSPTFTTDTNVGYLLQLTSSGKYIFNIEGTSYFNGFVNVNGNNYNYAVNSENVLKNLDISNHLLNYNKSTSQLDAFDTSYNSYSSLYSLDNKNQQAGYSIGLLHKSNETDILAVSRKIGEIETILFALDTSGVTYYTPDGINNLKNLIG